MRTGMRVTDQIRDVVLAPAVEVLTRGVEYTKILGL